MRPRLRWGQEGERVGRLEPAAGFAGARRGAPGWTDLEPLRRKAAGDVSPAGRKGRGREQGVRRFATLRFI